MFSNLIEKNQAFEKKEELMKIRTLLISTFISYPLWGLLSKYMAPEAYDPIWQRLACSLLSGMALYLSFTYRNFHKHQEKCYFIAWIYTYHLLFLYWKNPDSVYYAICNIIQFPYVILSFSTKKTAQVFTYTNFMAISLFAYFLTYKNINPWFFVLSMITIGHYVMTVLIQHFNVVTSLKKTKVEFDLALTNMLEGVILMDNSGVINSYNNAVLKILDFNETSHIGKSFKQSCLYDHCFKESLEGYNEEDHPFNLALKHQLPMKNIVLGFKVNSEVRWLLLNILPFDGSNNVLISFSDISYIKTKEELRVAKQAELAMNARLASLFAVAGGVAHEINNPLGIVIARLQSLNKKIEKNLYDEEIFRNSITKTINAAYRIAKIVTTLTSLSTKTDEDPEELVKLSDVVSEPLQLWTENFKIQGIDLIIDDIPEIYIKCQATQISQVIHNLLTNAYDSTLESDRRWVHISFSDLLTVIKITITDSGPEIPRDVKLKMMDPFFTTKAIGKGVGLGLSVSKAIIEKHKGHLYVDMDSPVTALSIELRKDNYLH